MYRETLQAAFVLFAVTSRYVSPSKGYQHSHEQEKARSAVTKREASPIFPCSGGLCLCDATKMLMIADCSGHPGGLSYVPRLPDMIRTLVFSNNRLTSIPGDKFFQNVTKIERLDLSNNGLTRISAGTFHVFSRLRWLILSNNNLNYVVLAPVLSTSTLTNLELDKCGLEKMPGNFFDNTSLIHLNALSLKTNSLGDVDLDVFRPLIHLGHLGLTDNRIQRTHIAYAMKFVYRLDLGTNTLSSFPETCDTVNASLFPELHHLSLGWNMITSVPKKLCLPKLTHLGLSFNNTEGIQTDSFSGRIFPALTTLFLSEMNVRLRYIQRNAFNNHRLKTLYLSSNNVGFSGPGIDKDSFANLPRIRALKLSGNDFYSVNIVKFIQMYGHLKTLGKLYLDNTRLQHISSKMFDTFGNLTNLRLNGNYISVIPDGVFDSLPRLHHLELARNQIGVVRSSAFGVETRKRLVFVDLTNNPFLCSCDALWFKAWLSSNPALFYGYWWSYNCSNIPGMAVREYFIDEQACLLTHGASVMIIVSVSLVLLTMTVICVVFRYRWHLRLVLYEAFRGRGDARRRRLANGRFDYDVFVSYDSRDLPWVRQHLMPELEGRLGLRLCIHERDFIIGRDIVDNISYSVKRSKKIMMVFSTSFLHSQWCQFELSLCLSHVMDYDDALIIVCLDDVLSRDMTAAMTAVLKTTTYIQWMDDDDAVMSFWGRLRISLNEITQNQNPNILSGSAHNRYTASCNSKQ